MDEKNVVELNDEALDAVAGGVNEGESADCITSILSAETEGEKKTVETVPPVLIARF